MTVRGGVGDIFPGILPAHFVTIELHQTNEVLSVTGQSHALVDIDFQIQFPAIALVVGAVFPVRHSAFLFLLLLTLYNRKTVLHTKLVRCFPKLFQRIFIAVVLETSFTAYGIDYEVGVDVIPVGMGCYYDFKAGDLFRQLQGNLMCLFWSDRIIGREGLNHVVVQPTFCAVVQPLGVHKFLQGTLGHTVDAADQRTTFIIHLGCFAAII